MTDRDASMGPDGLTRRDRDLIRDVLARYPDVRRVTLFGSRAMGTFGRGSDIDLALEGRDLDARTLTRIATELEDSDLPYKVDLLLRDEQLEPKLEAHIRRHGKPFGWKRSTWGEEISLEYGKSLKDYSDATSGFRVFGTNGPIGWTDKPIADGPGVILGRKGAYRGVHFSPNPFFVIDTAYYVVPKTELDMHWLYYAMIHYQLGQIDDGSPIPSTTRAAVYPREIVVPPFDEQRDISRALGALDDKVEQNRRTAQALEQLARSIFRAWFVDFEPVKAKAAGATSFPSMPQSVFDALPTRFVDSAIGPVPEGWVVKALSDAFEINPKRRLPKGASAPYLDMKNMPTEGHAPEEWGNREVGSGMKFVNGDTLVARITPCLENGKTAFVDFLPDGQAGWGSTEYIVLRPKSPLPDVFAYCLARTDEFRDYAIQNMTGTSGRQRVAAAAMDHYQIAVSTDDVAIAYGETVDPMFAVVRAGMNESSKLAEMRDYLLPKLLSGGIRVNDTKRFLGMVT